MNRLLAFLLVVLLSVTASAATQKLDLGGLYDLDSFSVPDAVRAPSSYVKLQSLLAAAEGNYYLVVEADTEPTWHLYSVTQPEGGTIRTTFELPEGSGVKAIFPTKPPHVDDKVVGFDVPIESHDGKIIWLVLLDVKEKPQSLQGTLKGQVCQEGEGGTCIPVSIPFDAEFDSDYDLKPLFAAAKTVPAQFIRLPEVEHVPASDTPITPKLVKPKEITEVTGLGTALLYAFLGGIILNIMPCVLPVIGLKILSFFEQAGKSRIRAFALNLSYSLGLLSVFFVLAFLSVGLSKMFTFDLFNIIMVCVVFAMALSLMDVWELSVPGFLGTGKSGELMRQEGFLGAFFKGIITTLLAIPCGAPLLSPAVNWADLQIRAGETSSVFLAYGFIGLGMASPYLLIGAFPELLRFLPKPGDWMETFKKIMGFCLLFAVVWILYFVQLERLLPTVALLFAIWFACWMIGHLEYSATAAARIRAWIASLIVLGVVLIFSFQIPGIENHYTLETAMKYRIDRRTPRQDAQAKHWKPYTPEIFERALKTGRPVIADFTADWCLTCKTLEAFVLETKPILDLLEQKEIASFVVDCTKEGDGTKFLREFGPEQVPVLVIYDPKHPTEPTVIRGGYTQKTLLDLLENL